MKRFWKDFCLRGMQYAWGGPVIVAIVWLCLQSAGAVTELTVNEAALGILSSTVMAFIAAGISVIYQQEKLPMPIAGLIQAAVLYVDYIGIYLLNGWLPVSKAGMFTLIFAAGFIAIWFAIYLSIRAKVKRMNHMLKQS